MQAQTAARYEDVLAHVTFTGTGGKDSRLVTGPLMGCYQTRVWDPGAGGLATPEVGGCLRAPPQQYDRCWRSGRTVG